MSDDTLAAGMRTLTEAGAQCGLTMQEAAAATAELARIMRPIFVQAAREAWPQMTPERQRMMAWIWEENTDA